MTSAGWGELEKRVKIWNNTTWQSLKKECACVLSRYSCVWLFVTLWIVVHQAPLFMGFSRQKYWSGLPCPLPGDLPHPGIKPESLMSPALAGVFLPLVPPGKPNSNLMEPNLSGKVQVSGIQLRIRKALIGAFKKSYISHIKKKKVTEYLYCAVRFAIWYILNSSSL